MTQHLGRMIPMTTLPPKVKDLSGRQIGSLEVVSFTGMQDRRSGNRVSLWTVVCIKCKNTFEIDYPRLTRAVGANKCGGCHDKG